MIRPSLVALVLVACLGLPRLARADVFADVPELQKNEKWSESLTLLDQHPDLATDYRYFYYRALAYYYLGVVIAGEHDEVLFLYFFERSTAAGDATIKTGLLQSLKEARKKGKKLLEQARTNVRIRQKVFGWVTGRCAPDQDCGPPQLNIPNPGPTPGPDPGPNPLPRPKPGTGGDTIQPTPTRTPR